MRRIYQCLNTTTTILCQQSLLLEALQEKVAAFLPANLQPHCQVAQFTKGQLVISISNPIFATELRYLLPKLRDQLRTQGHLYQLVAIKLKIQADPLLFIAPTKPSVAKKLSTNSQNLLIETAQKCSYEPLKEILLKISGKIR